MLVKNHRRGINLVRLVCYLKDVHKDLVLHMDYIPRIGELIIYPSFSKVYKVTAIEYWIDLDATGDSAELSRIQMVLERIKDG